jgi:hypothetical protein
MGDWTFFSNHGHVFFCLARNGDVRLRDVATDVGITERAVQKIVKDLQQAGYIEVRKQGRCNRYRINRRKSLRHPLESHCSVSKLVNLVAPGARAAAMPAMPVAETPPSPVPEDTQPDTAIAREPEPEFETRSAPPEDTSPDADVSPDGAAEPVAKSEPTASALETVDEETPAEDPAPARRGAGKSERKRDGKRKKKDKSEPIDIRQQGSLF